MPITLFNKATSFLSRKGADPQKDRETIQSLIADFAATKDVDAFREEVDALLAVYAEQPITTRLAQTFDAARLKDEITAIEDAQWFDQRDRYSGGYGEKEWETANLHSLKGDLKNQEGSMHGPADFLDTELLSHMPYTKEVLSYFQCPTYRIRVSRMSPGAAIVPHLDMATLRFHVVVQTNPEVYFFINGERIVMQEGELWFLDTSFIHSVENKGDTERIHILIDVAYNDWVKSLFPKNVPIENMTTQWHRNALNLRGLRHITDIKNPDAALEAIQRFSYLT